MNKVAKIARVMRNANVRVGAGEGRGKVVAVDILEMAPIAGVTFRQIDFLDPNAPAVLQEMLGGSSQLGRKTADFDIVRDRCQHHVMLVGVLTLCPRTTYGSPGR